MIPQNFEYSSPTDFKEALGLLAGGAKPLAGGMSLIPIMKLRLAAPEHLVDLGRIKGLNEIRESDGKIHIGAMTTHYEVESSPLIRARCPLLAETVGHIGDMQVRNRGSIGGSSAHADPAADYPASLLALGAEFVLASDKGERTVSAEDFFLDAFATALEPGELIREVIVPVEDQATGWSYKKVVQPASGYAIVGIAVRLRKAGDKIAFARIGVTGLAGIAYRAKESENVLEAGGSVEKAAAVVADGVEGNSDLFASANYRKHLAQVYAARALTTALGRT
jgi:carbon-monoxide dehydrogenase medium subunit